MVRVCIDCKSNDTITHSKKGYELWYKDGKGSFRCNRCHHKHRRTLMTQADREKERIYQRDSRRARTTLWWNKEYDRQKVVHIESPVVVQSETYAAQEILPKLGYTEIYLTRAYSHFFFCDIIAKDSEGRECAFDVKLGIRKDVDKKKMELIKRIGWRFFFIHVTPDLEFWHINEVKEGIKHSSAVIPYRKFLEEKKFGKQEVLEI